MDGAIPNKTLGQHWLNDKSTLEAICDAAEVGSGDTVLEIGPGQGTLTECLLSRKCQLTAVEYDPTLIPQLKKRFSDSANFHLEQGDIRTYDFGVLPSDYKLVANIPYYLTSFLMRRLTTEQTNKPSWVSLLVQKEVAQRVNAAPGNLSLISIATQFYYHVTLGKIVPANLFTPPPKVDSQILILRLLPKPLYLDVNPTVFMRIITAGFSQKRKTLVNSLSAGLDMPKDKISLFLTKSGIPSNFRAQQLSLDDWHKLYGLLERV